MRFTGQPLDIAIDGEGYFLLTNPVDSGTLYTRNGNLSLNRDSLLVLEANGSEYPINPAIQVPPDATAVTISPTGLVSVQMQKAELVAVGQLAMARFDDPHKLKRLTSAIYAETPESGPGCMCLPGRESVGAVIQGALAKHY